MTANPGSASAPLLEVEHLVKYFAVREVQGLSLIHI